MSLSVFASVSTLLFAVVVGAPDGRQPVRTGTVIESTTSDAAARTAADCGFGDALVMFAPCEPGKPRDAWTPERIRAVAKVCRERRMTFCMDEMFDRFTGELLDVYRPQGREILAALAECRDVYEGAWLFNESGGVMYYWPEAVVHGCAMKLPPLARFSEGDAWTRKLLRQRVAAAERLGLPRPYVNVEASFGFAAQLYRAGFDRVDFEYIYSADVERGLAGVKTAAQVNGRTGFGVDMAVCWYAGMYRDAYWEARWRTSLRHAWLRGCGPIYNEHGLMDWTFFGKRCGKDHPDVVKLRDGFTEFAAWARATPRAPGLPLAAVAAVQGRFDGFVGGFQTHLYGQRDNDRFRLGDADRAWELFDGLYRRRSWQSRDIAGEADYSGNPPLGQADILPYDAPDAAYARYRTLFFLGRNVMDRALYDRLVRYVRGGGTLILTASHLDTADAPGAAFAPFADGDWRELVGVRLTDGKPWHLPLGTKFTQNPAPGWKLQPFTDAWDPDFFDGGFDVPALEAAGAEPFAVASDRFLEENFPKAQRPVMFTHRLGRGRTIFVASLDSPGAPGMRNLFAFLLSKALEASDVWPKLECADTVRWAVYPDGTVYALNTEAHLAQEAILRRTAEAAPVRFTLKPGELRRIVEGRIR